MIWKVLNLAKLPFGAIQPLSLIHISLSSAWEGEAATAYINKFKSLETDIQTLIRMINEHVSDLNQMAEAYALSLIHILVLIYWLLIVTA